MINSELNRYAALYQTELLDNVMPFWTEHSVDKTFGGYFTCLTREGNVFDTDKFVWLQGRQVWMFAMLYNNVEKKKAWLDIALNGADFLKKYGRDKEGNWYFSLTREGTPLIQAYNIFSDCFAAMAFGELYKATGTEEFKQIAVSTYYQILERQEHPKGIYDKSVPGTRPLINFALPMILCNLSLSLEDVLGSQTTAKIVPELINNIMTNFYQEDTGLILENVSPEGKFVDSFEGRLISPGHVNESMWFLMDLAIRYNDQSLIEQAERILLRNTEFGWDKKYGGIFYFLDYKGYPPQQLEWDQKLWWVHLETLIAMAKCYKLTGNQSCKNWFEEIHQYSWKHFKDPEHNEWFGYLDRRGETLLTLKGGKWKGSFHVPRAMYEIWKTLSSPSPLQKDSATLSNSRNKL
ncbi:AGE family epimerase/isomerase [Prolixibacter sp. NT017]|uniref:AGE family epimerase/isomerase n=1 Tax=Prolixibacter sp. NT017 TaxID=2652390 RepID=UPI0012714FA8|nr:AGE family epimerase/isomerase [Prolixibacter sp. NT017]GET26443.1 N-acylglucosamine 2-epimerase [Prolixibacter sp. NT017]